MTRIGPGFGGGRRVHLPLDLERLFAPLLYLDSQEQFTVALALATFVRSQGGVQWNEMMAANLFSILPVLIVYFLAQNKLIGGIASVGLKG